MSAPSRAAIENAITRRVAYEAATDADVPGREGSTPAQIITYDNASLGWRVVVANGNRYTKTSMTSYASGGRITQEDGSGNATLLQGREIAATAPANGDALTWVSATSKWTPVAIPTTPLASAPPLALASTATPGTSAFAAHGDHVHPTTGLAVLASANVFTDLQTLSVSDGLGSTPTVCAVVRHTTGSPGSWCGATLRFEVSDGVTPTPIGGVRARLHSGTDGSFAELVPVSDGALRPTGLRARALTGACVNGVELIMGIAGVDPILQPCQETPPADLGMVLRPIGSGLVAVDRLGLNAGTVAQITTPAPGSKFASPQETQLALATDANGGGGALAVYSGGSWKMATLVPLV